MQYAIRIHLGNPPGRHGQLGLVCHIDLPALHRGSHDEPLQGILSPKLHDLGENGNLSLLRFLSRKTQAAGRQQGKAGESEEQE